MMMKTISTTNSKGEFVRAPSEFRNWVTQDGTAGPTGSGGFKAEPGRYHLYVAYNCPWAHRTLIFRALKKLEDVISISVAHPQRTPEGWSFLLNDANSSDGLNGFYYLKEAYEMAAPGYEGRYTVPVLWDKNTQTIVSNESADIIRMLNSAFNEFTPNRDDFYPLPSRAKIDEINTFVYNQINNGVYRAGFAKSQAAYEQAYNDVFAALDELEELLSHQHYLLGDQLTEADWRLFPTLIRFDLAYYGVFKCNKKRLVEYKNLWAYTRELYQYPGIAETVNVDHIKQGYWRNSERNPLGIIPVGPELDLWEPHLRLRNEFARASNLTGS